MEIGNKRSRKGFETFFDVFPATQPSSSLSIIELIGRDNNEHETADHSEGRVERADDGMSPRFPGRLDVAKCRRHNSKLVRPC